MLSQQKNVAKKVTEKVKHVICSVHFSVSGKVFEMCKNK
jgi:hypothetical protein